METINRWDIKGKGATFYATESGVTMSHVGQWDKSLAGELGSYGVDVSLEEINGTPTAVVRPCPAKNGGNCKPENPNWQHVIGDEFKPFAGKAYKVRFDVVKEGKISVKEAFVSLAPENEVHKKTKPAETPAVRRTATRQDAEIMAEIEDMKADLKAIKDVLFDVCEAMKRVELDEKQTQRGISALREEWQ